MSPSFGLVLFGVVTDLVLKWKTRCDWFYPGGNTVVAALFSAGLLSCSSFRSIPLPTITCRPTQARSRWNSIPGAPKYARIFESWLCKPHLGAYHSMPSIRVEPYRTSCLNHKRLSYASIQGTCKKLWTQELLVSKHFSNLIRRSLYLTWQFLLRRHWFKNLLFKPFS